MWTSHENTTLNAIVEELEDDPALPLDAEAIRAAILELITQKGDQNKALRVSSRAMVDWCDLAKRAFFHADAAGSSSIKKVLPAVMRASPYLAQRYSKPIYGSLGGIDSLNFTQQIWWQATDGRVESPYKLESGQDLEITEGGAATTAFARLQFDNVPVAERAAIEAAMLRCCELDTLAMVLIYEARRDWSA